MNTKIYTKCKEIMKEYGKLLLFFIAFYLILTVKLPWSIYAPGGAIDIGKRLRGETYKAEGSLNLTYVTFIEGTIPSLVLAVILPEWDIVPNKDITLEGEDLVIANIRDHIMMEESISNATFVAYSHVDTTSLEKTATNTYINYIIDTAETDLQVGDKIIAYDNIEYVNFESLVHYVQTKDIGDSIQFNIIRNKKEQTKNAKVIDIEGSKKIGLSVAHSYDYNKTPEITYKSKSSESGPSGGLMLSLAIYNALTPEDMTKGLKISGTGTIDEEGNVGEISGIKYKLSGAVKKGSDIFLVPTANYAEAIEVQKKHKYKIKIIEAKTFEQVLKELKEI